MADYNTFLKVDTKSRRPLMVTSSARKCLPIKTGERVEVWNDNTIIKKIYSKTSCEMKEYILAEKEYIRRKQEKAEQRNKRRIYGK